MKVHACNQCYICCSYLLDALAMKEPVTFTCKEGPAHHILTTAAARNGTYKPEGQTLASECSYAMPLCISIGKDKKTSSADTRIIHT